MSDLPTCPLCGRPIIDMAYMCDRCAGKTAVELERAALVAGEAATTITKQARLGSGGRRTDTEAPLPVNLAAAADHDAAVNTLTTWARHIHESSGRVIPAARTATCRHVSCARRREGRVDGPLCEIAEPEHPTAVLGRWLAGQLDWLRHRPEAEKALDEIGDACRILVRVVDRPAERIVVGQCACTEYLYAVRGREHVTCAACGTTYRVEETRNMLRNYLDQRLFTAAEIATLATYLGLKRPREATRKLINKWCERGVVVSHTALDGDPAFRFGEVVARLMVA